jgi:hypothetical protein
MPVTATLPGMRSLASRTRQRLRDLLTQYEEQLELLLEERGPLIRGTYGTRRRVCGEPTCRCVRGELHESTYLSASDHGRTRQVHVPASEEPKVTAGVERYRHFLSGRVRLSELAQQQLELVDELGRSLLEGYPPGNPLPPAQKRGRPPKGGRHA